MSEVYLLHLSRPVSRGISKRGTQLVAGHYIGSADDLIERLDQHARTTRERLEEPIILETGEKITGVKHGPGATFIGFVNSQGIGWGLAREWIVPDGMERQAEARIKAMKCAPKLCPVCNPDAYRLASKIFI